MKFKLRFHNEIIGEYATRKEAEAFIHQWSDTGFKDSFEIVEVWSDV